MKNIIMLSALTGVLTLSGCTTMKDMMGMDNSGMKDMMGMDNSGMQNVNSTRRSAVPVASLNGVLVDAANHMTLYTFDKDSMNKSECGSVCQVAWPAFMAPNNAKATGQFATFKRDDGKYQWAVNGKPLYFYANDDKAGDNDGDGKFDVWHVVKTK